MSIRRRTPLTGAAALTMPSIHPAQATSEIKIDVLPGRYAKASGLGNYLAAQMAAEDFKKLHRALTVGAGGLIYC